MIRVKTAVHCVVRCVSDQIRPHIRPTGHLRRRLLDQPCFSVLLFLVPGAVLQVRAVEQVRKKSSNRVIYLRLASISGQNRLGYHLPRHLHRCLASVCAAVHRVVPYAQGLLDCASRNGLRHLRSAGPRPAVVVSRLPCFVVPKLWVSSTKNGTHVSQCCIRKWQTYFIGSSRCSRTLLRTCPFPVEFLLLLGDLCLEVDRL